MTAGVAVEEGQLPAAFREGLAALRKHVPDAAVIAVHDNFAYIDLGEIPADDLALYQQTQVQIFVRVPLTFPNAAPYGIATAPFLVRKDGAQIERQHHNHANAAPVAAYLGRQDLGFWSWDWSNMPLRRSEDLAAIMFWALKRIRQG